MKIYTNGVNHFYVNQKITIFNDYLRKIGEVSGYNKLNEEKLFSNTNC